MSNEYLNNHGASHALAKNIEAYWHGEGFPNVKAWVEEFYMAENEELAKRAGARPLYAVRSNIAFAELS